MTSKVAACPACKSSVPAGSPFCDACGAKVDTVETHPCVECGAPVDPASTFCDSCGTPVPSPSRGVSMVAVLAALGAVAFLAVAIIVFGGRRGGEPAVDPATQKQVCQPILSTASIHGLVDSLPSLLLEDPTAGASVRAALKDLQGLAEKGKPSLRSAVNAASTATETVLSAGPTDQAVAVLLSAFEGLAEEVQRACDLPLS